MALMVANLTLRLKTESLFEIAFNSSGLISLKHK